MTKRKSRVQKHTDGAGMHKRPENRMWLPMGRQLETVMYVFPSRHKENAASKQTNNLPSFLYVSLKSTCLSTKKVFRLHPDQEHITLSKEKQQILLVSEKNLFYETHCPEPRMV